jgi:hypothetical protein
MAMTAPTPMMTPSTVRNDRTWRGRAPPPRCARSARRPSNGLRARGCAQRSWRRSDSSRPSRTTRTRDVRRHLLVGDVTMVMPASPSPGTAPDLGGGLAVEVAAGSSARSPAAGWMARAMATPLLAAGQLAGMMVHAARPPGPARSAGAALAAGQRWRTAAAAARCRARWSARAGRSSGTRSPAAAAQRRQVGRAHCRHLVAEQPVGPGVGRSRQPSRFISVVLPDPDGPMMATNSP